MTVRHKGQATLFSTVLLALSKLQESTGGTGTGTGAPARQKQSHKNKHIVKLSQDTKQWVSHLPLLANLKQSLKNFHKIQKQWVDHLPVLANLSALTTRREKFRSPP